MRFRQQDTKRLIEKFGNQLIGVFPTATDPGEYPWFTYTIGNHERGHPEFLCIVNADVCGGLLNTLSTMQKTENKALTGDVSLGGEFPVRLIDATNEINQFGRYRCSPRATCQLLRCGVFSLAHAAQTKSESDEPPSPLGAPLFLPAFCFI